MRAALPQRQKNGGRLTSALGTELPTHKPTYDDAAYRSRFYNGYGHADENEQLVFGPNITDWPEIPELGDGLLSTVCSVITDPVTTTDELIPSGETSSYRSNPLGLAEFTLSRRDPGYVGRAKAAHGAAPRAKYSELSPTSPPRAVRQHPKSSPAAARYML